MQQFLDNVFSKCQCGFCQGYNLQHYLITIIEKWCKSVEGV